MYFDVVEPIVLKRFTKNRHLNKKTQLALKSDLKELDEGLIYACGCYVFATRAGKGFTPHYVGQACKTPIFREATNPANLSKYNDVLAEKKGAPLLFIIPMLTPTGKYKKTSKAANRSDALDFLESWLIGVALNKNPNLINNKLTKFLKNIHVAGVFNARHGESTGASQALCKALSL